MVQWEPREIATIEVALKSAPNDSISQVARRLLDEQSLPGRSQEGVRRQCYEVAKRMKEQGITRLPPLNTARKGAWTPTETNRLIYLRREHKDLAHAAFAARFAGEFQGRTVKAIELKLYKLDSEQCGATTRETIEHEESRLAADRLSNSAPFVTEVTRDVACGSGETVSPNLVATEGGKIVEEVQRLVQRLMEPLVEENFFFKERCRQLEQMVSKLEKRLEIIREAVG